MDTEKLAQKSESLARPDRVSRRASWTDRGKEEGGESEAKEEEATLAAEKKPNSTWSSDGGVCGVVKQSKPKARRFFHSNSLSLSQLTAIVERGPAVSWRRW